MVKRFKFYARGLVLVVYGNGTKGMLPTVEFEADSYVELMSKANLMFYDDTLLANLFFPNEFGIKDTLGAVLDIKRRTYIEIEDENFVSSKLMFDSVGELTMSEYEMLQGELLFKYKGK